MKWWQKTAIWTTVIGLAGTGTGYTVKTLNEAAYAKGCAETKQECLDEKNNYLGELLELRIRYQLASADTAK